jgi:ubiquinone/menaquinone biosynthesis C-methylase UbiE
MDAAQHQAEIVDQFTRQAEPFLNRHAQGHEDLLELMADCASLSAGQVLLDAACGPGIVSCFFAARVHHVTGLDLVPAMLDRARRLQADRGLENIDWRLGECTRLPFADAGFDCVVTRFSFHHFLDPHAVLGEMQRVCRPGGTVLVADVTPSEQAQAGFNHWEILRDPSHTRALTRAEFRSLGQTAGLAPVREERFELVMDLEGLLKGSFPNPGDEDRIRSLFEEEISRGRNTLGVAPHREQGAIWISYPVTVFAWRNLRPLGGGPQAAFAVL